eukprot:contig_28141_g6913
MRGGTGPWRCQRCLKCVTPCHRPGPGGKGTLCNEAAANGAEQGVAGGVVQAVADGTEQAVADSAEQAVADGTDQAAAALSAATAEAQAAAAQVVAAADSPAPSGSPTVDVAAGVPSIRPSADAFTDGATGPAPPGSASASPSTRPQAAGTPVRNPSPVADTASERSFEQEGADPWWCPQCATPDLPCPRVERGGKARCEVCGLTWTDEQVREQLGGTSDGGTPMEMDAAAADGAAQEDVEQGTSGAWQCHHCGTFDGFCHRPGPGGVGTLCNTCGLKWKDQLRREERAAALAAESALDTDVAVAAAAVQKRLDESLAAAASRPAVDRAVSGAWQCEHCGSQDMFCHRPGPSGMGTLCNACGLKWRDEQMQQQLAVVSNTDAVHESSVVAADVAPARPVAAAPDPFLTAPRKASSEPWECQRCTVTSTTCRRSGPGGRSTLCNACGLRWKDQLKREKKAAALAAESALDTDVAVAAAAVQQQLDEVSAA